MKNLCDANWTVKTYNTAVGLCLIDMVQHEIRRTFELIIEVYPTPDGVDGLGHRAIGSAVATVISARPEPKVEHPLVFFGEIVFTPFGNYKVDHFTYYGPVNEDWLSLTEVK